MNQDIKYYHKGWKINHHGGEVVGHYREKKGSGADRKKKKGSTPTLEEKKSKCLDAEEKKASAFLPRKKK